MRGPEPTANSDRRARRKRLAWVAGSLLLSLLVLCGGLAAYVAIVNQVPPYTPPPVTLPVPNAYDDFVAAAMLVHETNDIQTVRGREPQTAALRKSAAANREAIARFRAGFQHDYLTPPQYDVQPRSPELTRFRSLARVLCADGLLHQREGRFREAARCYLDTIRFGTTVPRGGSLIHWLVGVAIQSIGLARLQQSVDQLDVATARNAARELLRLERDGTRYPDALRSISVWETVDTTATLRRLRTLNDYEQFAGWAAPPGSSTDWWLVARLLLKPKTQIIRDHEAYLTRLIEIEKQPYYARPPLPPIPGDAYNELDLPVVTQAGLSAVKEEALVRIVAVQLAARAYTLEHGAPPPNAQALVPQYLDKVPDDPFAPRPITLRVKDGKALVYSVGPDGVDDGGTPFKGVISPTSKGDYLTVRAQK